MDTKGHWENVYMTKAIVAGAIAGSISLVGFGVDSFIEVTSGATLLWRMAVDSDEHNRERHEKQSLRIVGVCFLAFGGLHRLRIGLRFDKDEKPLSIAFRESF